MSDRYTSTAPDRHGSPAGIDTGETADNAPPQPAETADDAVLHDEIEAWINEGGAGDEPGP